MPRNRNASPALDKGHIAFDKPFLAQPKGHLIYVKLAPPQPTVVFDTYWRFACKRQELFFKKLRNPGLPPWTDDPILRRHKFTNAYRASDRVSQYLIRRVIYTEESDLQTPEEVFFRTILFKLFNKVETWELLERELGAVRWAEYSFDYYTAILNRAMAEGAKIYSAAYIMASGQSAFGHPRKHANHLCMLERMMADRLPERLFQAQPDLQTVYEAILPYPAIGPFLAYQYAIDLNYGLLRGDLENQFVMPGPGALDGIAKCFADLGGYTPQTVIHWVRERQQEEFTRLGLTFPDLWGRPLTLIDCQNLFCETDKYARAMHPEFKGRSNRSRIKQVYKPTPEGIDYWYPPKWDLNDIIAAEKRGRG